MALAVRDARELRRERIAAPTITAAHPGHRWATSRDPSGRANPSPSDVTSLRLETSSRGVNMRMGCDS